MSCCHSRHDGHAAPVQSRSVLTTALKWIGAATALIAIVWLVSERSTPGAWNWAYLVILACPLLHLFMGHHGRKATGDAELQKKSD